MWDNEIFIVPFEFCYERLICYITNKKIFEKIATDWKNRKQNNKDYFYNLFI